MRTLVLLAGGALLVALAGFLLLAHLRSRFNVRDLPKRLGVNIQVEENGFTLTRAHGGHTEFKMHASKMVRLKEGERALLNDVEIELYGKGGETVDRIRGGQFGGTRRRRKRCRRGRWRFLSCGQRRRRRWLSPLAFVRLVFLLSLSMPLGGIRSPA